MRESVCTVTTLVLLFRARAEPRHSRGGGVWSTRARKKNKEKKTKKEKNQSVSVPRHFPDRSVRIHEGNEKENVERKKGKDCHEAN